MIFQRSIKNEVSAVGVGLHSGKKVRIVLKPAKENSGIIFKRIDTKIPVEIKVQPQAVKETRLSSTIGKDKFKISTVEHLMSALSAPGLTQSVFARSPKSKLKAPSRMDLPAPDSPVMPVKPALKDTSRASTRT